MNNSLARAITALLALLVAVPAGADTREGYENSTTRQQIERMDENNRANAPDASLNIPSTNLQGTGLQGWMNNLQAEEEEARAQKAEQRRRAQAELDARWAEESARMKEREARMEVDRARDSARERGVIAARQAGMMAYIDSLPREQPMQVANYDRLLEIAAPYAEIMLPLMQSAYRDYPKSFALRMGYLKLSSCPGMRSLLLAEIFTLYNDEMVPRDTCVMAQLSAALPYLAEARQTGDALDAALACALMAGAYGSLSSFDPRTGSNMSEAGRPRIAAWLDKRLQPCATAVPAGSPLYEGLVAPLVHQVERISWHDRSVRVNSPLWWPLLARSTWQGVDLQDAAAVRRVYDNALVQYRAAYP